MPMERLTVEIAGHVYYTKGKYPETIPAECESDDVRNILTRLAKYEDIDMTPEEIKAMRDQLAAYKKYGLDPSDMLIYKSTLEDNAKLHIDLSEAIKIIAALKSEKDALADRCGGTIPVHCADCELWGSNGWGQQGVGYCEGDDKPHEATGFCSYGKQKEQK